MQLAHLADIFVPLFIGDLYHYIAIDKLSANAPIIDIEHIAVQI